MGLANWRSRKNFAEMEDNGFGRCKIEDPISLWFGRFSKNAEIVTSTPVM